MPIFMRVDSLGNESGGANFIHITRDKRGFEVLYSYTDRFGFPQKNKDGAYMTRRDYDDNGNQTLEASLNIVGDPMIDEWGNCGWESTYENNLQKSFYYFNNNWQHMPMPKLRVGSRNVYGYKYDYDEYGRLTEELVIDSLGNPDVDEFGVHKTKTSYNEHGLYDTLATYDINGALQDGELGIAQIVCDFDSIGNLILHEYRNSKGEYVVGSEGYCKREFKYRDGNRIAQIDYITDDKCTLEKSFEFRIDSIGNSVKKWYQDDEQRIDSVDTNGRIIMSAWYDLSGSPIEFNGLHKKITRYRKDHDEVEIWLDKDGNEYVDNERGFSKSVTDVDSINNIMTNYQYWHGMLKQSFQKQFTPGFERIVSQWDITPYGEHARVGWWNNLHYTCDVDYTMYGEIRTMVGRNEFDEPSYLTFLGSSGEVYHFSDLNNGKRRYYDEDGKEIPDSLKAEFKSKLPRVFCVEVTDTAKAFPLGLKNGDIILSYGDWMTSSDLNTDVDYFYLETIKMAQSTKPITLLRHNPNLKSSEIVSLELPCGRTSDLGFYPHKIYYTKKEKERLLNTCSNSGLLLKENILEKDSTILLAVQTKGGLEQTLLYHHPHYNVKDPGVVLYAKEKYDKGIDTWSFVDNVEKWDKQNMFYIRGANLYITHDMQSTRHIEKNDKDFAGMTFVPLKVSTEMYKLLQNCYQELEDSIIKPIKHLPIIPFKKMSLCGKWNMTDSIENGNCSITMDFNKNGELQISTDLIIEEESLAGDSLKLSLSMTTSEAKWHIDGNKILINLDSSKDNYKIDFDVVCDDEQKKDSYIKNIESKFAEDLSVVGDIIREFGLIKIYRDIPLEIYPFSKKSFILYDRNKTFEFMKMPK